MSYFKYKDLYIPSSRILQIKEYTDEPQKCELGAFKQKEKCTDPKRRHEESCFECKHLVNDRENITFGFKVHIRDLSTHSISDLLFVYDTVEERDAGLKAVLDSMGDAK